MSSGDKAKPPTTFEERNPFDISRRSGIDVAAEIAKRMAAWKQARSRADEAPSTLPAGAAKQPAPAAPVQPVRTPRSAAPDRPQTQAAAPADRTSAGNAARVPYFALPAVRRAMPPAPSLKQGSVRTPVPTGSETVLHPDEPAVRVVAPVLEQPSHETASRPDETPPADPHSISVDSHEESACETPAQPQPADSIGAPLVDRPNPMPIESEDCERRRDEARAIKARWMAAHHPDALIDAPGASSTEAAAQDLAAGKLAHEPQLVAEDRDGLQHREQRAMPEHDAAPEAPAGEGPEPATGSSEPTLDTRMTRVSPALRAGRDVAWETPALGLAALDEMAGRSAPTLPDIAADDAAAEEPPAQPAAPEPAAVAHRDGEISIAALDEVAGRKEPTFDVPVQPASGHRKERDVAKPAAADDDAAKPAWEAADGASQPGIALLDEAAGRREPTFDDPIRVIKPAAPAAAPHIALRPMETRIEARRIEPLRADPQLSAHRPIFPPAEPDEWDVPAMIAAQAHQEDRRGTGWAIGLGAILLIAGMTAPAAIWQQEREVQDQAALVTPAPAPQQTQTSAPDAATMPQPHPEAPPQPPRSEAPSQAMVPAAPPHESAPPAPAIATEDRSAPGAPGQAAVPEAEQIASSPATALGTISDGGEVGEAPVVAPPVVAPPPMVNLASKTDSAGARSPMAARAFVPAQGEGPFLRAPTTGVASVPVVAAPVQPAGTDGKPNLIGQLKPKPTMAAAKPVAAKPRPVTRKPKPFFQQTPEQMFETLIETLSEGKPVNPATRPAAPSDRR